MKVIHIESGLGNQMLSYCEYLAMKHCNPDEDCYIETAIYELPEADSFVSQWNGYELDRVFEIQAPNIKGKFSDEQWGNILDSLARSEFWKKNWNWPVYTQHAFEENGLYLENFRGDFEKENIEWNISRWKSGAKPPISYRLKQTGLYANARRLYRTYAHCEKCMAHPDQLFFINDRNLLTGQRLLFKYRGNKIEDLDEQIRNAFNFPEITDEKNKKMAEHICRSQSVAIHARRGDMLTANGKYYKSGYFARAVKYIKQKIDKPEIFFFCDSGSMDWCRNNGRIFGLNFDKDRVNFVDWNKSDESYRDMQLMAMCKHNIVTNSSFGWWGAYLNQNPDKITISPEIEINTTYHC